MSTRRLLATTGTQLGTAAGTLIALAAWDQSKGLRVFLAILVGAFALSVIVVEIKVYFSERASGYGSPSRINRFMHDWISERGHVAIFSRDMSWVSDDVHTRWYESLWRRFRHSQPPSIRHLLFEKAKRGELTLCLPVETDLARELRDAGARVATYAALDVVPEARFTIVRYGQQDAEVAIGRREGGVHRIERFMNGRHPAFAMAEDLVRMVTSYSERF
jgi:hypothetical protein